MKVMKALIILTIAVVLAAVAGWVTFSRTDDKASINIETKAVRKDTREAVEVGQKLLNQASSAVKAGTRDTDTQPSVPDNGTGQR